MPEPAGTGLDRRSFLMRSGGVALSVYGGLGLGPVAYNEAIAAASGGDHRVLVSVFLDGGLDHLSLLAPVDDPVYQSARPTLKLDANPAHTFAGDSRLQWHPDALAFKALHDAGKMTVFPAVGYSNANQSHFTSRHFWQTGSLDLGANTGWLGRYLDRVGDPDIPLQGLSLGWMLSPALAAAEMPVASLGLPSDYQFPTYGVGGPVADKMFEAFGDLGRLETSDVALARARRVVRHTDGVRRSMEPLVGQTISSQATYPTGNALPEQLAALAEMLTLGLPIRCVAINGHGAYDTHSGQEGTLANNLAVTAESIAAFQQDIEARGLADRVLIQVWSEFGRRIAENGGGTDHGAAGVAMLIGTKVRDQLVGEWPGLASLDEDDNMLHTSDFRVMYAAVLDQWLQTDPEPIIPGADAMVLPELIAA